MANSGNFKTGDYNGRYLVFAWTEKSQSIENNTTTISWTLTGAGEAEWTYYLCQNIKFTIAGETVFQHTLDDAGQIKLGIGTVVASGEYTLKHNNDGTKNFTAYAEAGIYNWDVNCTGTGTFTLDTIPRASSLTAANGTLDVEQTLTINRAASSFKHRLTYRCGDVAGYIAGSASGYTTATSIKWTPLIGLAHENTTGTAVSIELTLYTYTSDGTHVGTTTEFITCAIPTSVKPSVTIAWKDLSDAATKYGNPVQGLSYLEITLTEQTSYSSPISYRSITANGATAYENPATTDVLKSAGSQKIAATIKDQRGRSGSNSANLDVLAYTAPVVSRLTVHRCNADGTENDQGDHIRVQFSAAITPLNNKNSATYKLRYKISSATSYTEIDLTALAGQYTVTDYTHAPIAADGNRSVDVEIVATDNHGTATRATSASTAFTLMNWLANGTGMAVGKVAERENTMEVALTTYLSGDARGRVMGLGKLDPIAEGANANDFTSPGAFAVTTDAIAATITNLPIPRAGRLYVSACTGSTVEDNSVWQYREQKYVPYRYGSVTSDYPAFVRYIARNGTTQWEYTPWINEALKAYPVGSIHLRYDTQNPADLFGGTWVQITARVLRAGSAGSIGSEGTIADGSGRTYIDVAVWRRTA